MIDALLAPFQHDFMLNAFYIGVIIAVPAALLSSFLVLKGWSLMGDAVSHAVLPGIVIAYVLKIPMIFGAFTAGMLCALATGYLQARSRVKQDTVMGVVFSGMFGLGIVLYTWAEPDVHLDHILFGNIQGVGSDDLILSGAISVVVTGLIALTWRDLFLHAFDPIQARAVGLRVRTLHFGLLALVSLTVVAALKAVGIILAIALLISPGAIAYLLARRFSTMLLTAVGVAVAAALAGVYASFFLDSAPAPTIVLALTLAFVAAFVRTVVRGHGPALEPGDARGPSRSGQGL